MFISKPAHWLALVAVSACSAAMAQGNAAADPPPPYRSALEGYKPFTEEKVSPWAESNATVGKIGGWRAYAKEAAEGQSPVQAGTPPSAQPAKPAGTAAPTGGHKH